MQLRSLNSPLLPSHGSSVRAPSMQVNRGCDAVPYFETFLPGRLPQAYGGTNFHSLNKMAAILFLKYGTPR